MYKDWTTSGSSGRGIAVFQEVAAPSGRWQLPVQDVIRRMPVSCEHCKTGERCNFDYDLVFQLDQYARMTLVAFALDDTGDTIGRRVDELVQPEDADYVLQRAMQAITECKTVCWLSRDVLNRHDSYTRVQPTQTQSSGFPVFVGTSRSVCPLVFQLSPRQREMLHQWTLHCCSKKLATALGISRNTVNTHLYRAQLAAQRHDFADLLRWASNMQHALVIEDEIQAYLTRRQG